MMKKKLALIVGLALVIGFAQTATAVDIPKQGTHSATETHSGTYKVIQMGEEAFRMTYETMGVVVNDAGEAFLNNVSLYCIGSLFVEKGMIVQHSGSIVYTDLEGDKIFVNYEGTGGKVGAAKGRATFVGGTGKYTGITGGQNWAHTGVHPAADGTMQGITKFSGHWKLP
jgi:hypothetical protein